MGCSWRLECFISNQASAYRKTNSADLGGENDSPALVGWRFCRIHQAIRRYSHLDGNAGAGDALVLVRHLRRTTLYRAVRPGQETIVIGPDVARGECISCATLHYFITIVARNE